MPEHNLAEETRNGESRNRRNARRIIAGCGRFAPRGTRREQGSLLPEFRSAIAGRPETSRGASSSPFEQPSRMLLWLPSGGIADSFPGNRPRRGPHRRIVPKIE